MKKILLTASLVLTVGLLSLSAFAQRVETESDLFNKISKLTQTKKTDDQKKAYDLSKIYMQKFSNEDAEKARKIKAFMENFETAHLGKLIDDGKTSDAFAFGKQILESNPDNSKVTMELAFAGFQALEKKKDKSFGKDSIEYAKTTLRLFGENKLPKEFAPFSNQTEATAMMYFIIGNFLGEDNLQESAVNFYKSVQYDSQIKSNFMPYYYIALYYHRTYEKLAAEFEKKYAGKSTDDKEATAANEKLGKLLSLMMDAYARAAKLGEEKKVEAASNWKAIFSQIYQGVNGGQTGMNEYYDKVFSQPLADPSTL